MCHRLTEFIDMSEARERRHFLERGLQILSTCVATNRLGAARLLGARLPTRFGAIFIVFIVAEIAGMLAITRRRRYTVPEESRLGRARSRSDSLGVYACTQIKLFLKVFLVGHAGISWKCLHETCSFMQGFPGKKRSLAKAVGILLSLARTF